MKTRARDGVNRRLVRGDAFYEATGIHHAGPGAIAQLIKMLVILPARQDESRWETR